jgi:hypothetical protein
MERRKFLAGALLGCVFVGAGATASADTFDLKTSGLTGTYTALTSTTGTFSFNPGGSAFSLTDRTTGIVNPAVGPGGTFFLFANVSEVTAGDPSQWKITGYNTVSGNTGFEDNANGGPTIQQTSIPGSDPTIMVIPSMGAIITFPSLTIGGTNYTGVTLRIDNFFDDLTTTSETYSGDQADLTFSTPLPRASAAGCGLLSVLGLGTLIRRARSKPASTV